MQKAGANTRPGLLSATARIPIPDADDRAVLSSAQQETAHSWGLLLRQTRSCGQQCREKPFRPSGRDAERHVNCPLPLPALGMRTAGITASYRCNASYLQALPALK